jgi:hypothetical protein
MVITSTSPVMGVTKDDGKSKPAVMKAYDYGMLGTDRKNISIYLQCTIYSYYFFTWIIALELCRFELGAPFILFKIETKTVLLFYYFFEK